MTTRLSGACVLHNAALFSSLLCSTTVLDLATHVQLYDAATHDESRQLGLPDVNGRNYGSVLVNHALRRIILYRLCCLKYTGEYAAAQISRLT